MKEHVLNRKKGCLIAVLFLVGMLVGSLFDYQISTFLYHEQSGFGKLFAAYGQAPVALGCAVVCVLMFCATKKEWSITTILAYIGCIILLAFALMMATMEPMMYLSLSSIPAFLLAVVEVGITMVLTYRYCNGMETKKLKKIAGFLAFVIFGQLILINVIKPLAARPRMRMIAITPEASFQPWWVFGSEMKNSLMSTLQIASEEFKSFPSGHAACAAVSMAFCILPYVKGKGNANRWFYVALAFTLTVMFSRMIMGAHFLSDVMMGFGVSFLVIMIGKQLILERK